MCKMPFWRGSQKENEKHRIFQGLLDMVDYLKDKIPMGRVIEIGCFAGQSTELFAENFDEVVAVDPWEYKGIYWEKFGIERIFDEMAAQHPNIIKLKCTSAKAASIVPGLFDFVYIDGNHTEKYVKQDIELWRPKCIGIIGGHDYGIAQWCDVKTVVDRMLGVPDKVFQDYSWVKRI